MSFKTITEELNMDKETVRQNITKNLNMRKVCAKMVPKNLNKGQKCKRKKICSEI
jgi:hypothetical protein